MDPTSRFTQTAQEFPESVREITDSWKVKRPTYSLSPRLNFCLIALVLILTLALIFSSVLLICARDEYFYFGPTSSGSPSQGDDGNHNNGVADDEGNYPFADGATGNALLPWAEHATPIPADSIHSSFAAMADLATGEIIASRKADEIIYPASMTKVMTLIVVVENLPSEASLRDTITVSNEVFESMRAQGSSGIGMETGEQLTVEAMLYALMLRSDGIAACELARYVAGSEQEFVALMNKKAEMMGLTNTHFENPTGLYHKDHKTTSREIASIMAYAMNMNLCRKIMMTQSYIAPCVGANGKTFDYNLYHNLIVTQFEERSEKGLPIHPNSVKVAAGKTGFTDESRFCLVTYAEAPDGHGYVCVTAKSASYAECISDYLTIYNSYAKP